MLTRTRRPDTDPIIHRIDKESIGIDGDVPTHHEIATHLYICGGDQTCGNVGDLDRVWRDIPECCGIREGMGRGDNLDGPKLERSPNIEV
jgi:hypothetical protein